MLIQVQFKNAKGDGWMNRTYAYKCDFDVQVGDLVEVPAGEETKTVRVAEINVPEYTVKSDVFPKLKSVIRAAEYEGNLFEQNDGGADPALPPAPAVELNPDIIVIRQLPIIEDQLRNLRETVEEKVNEALSLAVTDDTVVAVKKTRAALNKEYNELEGRRKQVKLAILEPYDRFEATYRETIGNLYTDAYAKLTAKINEVENGIKDAKRASVREYFLEYRASLDLQDEEAAAFEKWPVNITKSESEKSLRTRAKAYLDIIKKDLTAISGMQYPDEMIVEYRRCRDLAEATARVNERHRLAEEARKRREAEEAAKAEREAREREVVAKVEAAMQKAEPLEPPKAEPAPAPDKDPNELFPRVGPFVLLNVTRAQVIKFKNFLNQEGIHYGKP